MTSTMDGYFKNATLWAREMGQLRKIILDCGLSEALKWGKPCYSFQDSNVVIIQGFKQYCALLFFKGVLLKDPDGILVKTGENTRVGRQIRFTDSVEIARMAAILKTYIYQAIEVEKAGLKVKSKLKPTLSLSEELIAALSKNPSLKAAFNQLTPGRQRAYNIFFSAPKQSKTRESRIAKCTNQILKGKGLMDR